MASGTMEVLLVDAKGMGDADFFGISPLIFFVKNKRAFILIFHLKSIRF